MPRKKTIQSAIRQPHERGKVGSTAPALRNSVDPLLQRGSQWKKRRIVLATDLTDLKKNDWRELVNSPLVAEGISGFVLHFAAQAAFALQHERVESVWKQRKI